MRLEPIPVPEAGVRKFLLIGLVVAAAAVLGRWHSTRETLSGWKASLQGGVSTVTGEATVQRGQKTAQMLLRRRVERAVREYRSLNGKQPSTLSDLVRENLLQREDLADPWGRSLMLEPSGTGLRLRCAGPDGMYNTADDWTLDV